MYDLCEMKKSYPYYQKVKVILCQNAYEISRPLEYKNSGRNKPWAVKLPLGWTVSGPLPKRDLKVCDASCKLPNLEDLELAEDVKKWWDMESYGTLIVANQ